MKKIILSILLLATSNVFANCAIIGWPGCSYEDFQRALQIQRQQDLQEQQLREMKRANELRQEMIDQQRMQRLHNLIGF